MRVGIWREERWPDYWIDTLDEDYEVTEELYRRYLKAREEYGAVQIELEKVYKGVVPV